MSASAVFIGMVAGTFASAYFGDSSYLVAVEHSFWLCLGGLTLALVNWSNRT